MPDAALAKKLQIKPGAHVLVLDAPAGYLDGLAVPAGATVAHRASGKFDLVQLFVRTQGDVAQRAPAAEKACRAGGIIWICWPKASKLGTDLNRDVLFAEAQRFGLQAVSNVSIDDTWSALRFRRIAKKPTNILTARVRRGIDR